jgi:hypothetical protein
MKRLGRWIFTGLAAVSLVGLVAWVCFWVCLPLPCARVLGAGNDRRFDLSFSSDADTQINIVVQDARPEPPSALSGLAPPILSLRFSQWLPLIATGSLPAIWLLFFLRRRRQGSIHSGKCRRLLNRLSLASLVAFLLTVNLWVTRPNGNVQSTFDRADQAYYFGVDESDSAWTGRVYIEKRDLMHLGLPLWQRTYWSYDAPCWLLAAISSIAPAISGIAPAIWVVRLVTRKKKYAPGRCARCGYDLRATPERCPECGWIVGGS